MLLTKEQIEHTIRTSPALEDLPDSRDFQLDEIVGGSVDLPETFELEGMTPVRNQGSRGTCSAFATAAVSEFFNAREYNSPHLNLSEEFLFKKIKQIDKEDYGYEGYGAYARSAVKAYNKYGMCEEITLPYSPDRPEDHWKQVAISQDMEREALQYRSKGYAAVRISVEAIKTALAQTYSPLLCGFMLYSSYSESFKDGRIPVAKDGETQIGGHFMAIVGYDKTHFKVKNSWGSLGDKGYFYWPFEAIGKMFSCWATIDHVEETDEYIIRKNREQIPSEWGQEALDAFDAAVNAGIFSKHTKPMEQMLNLQYAMFLLREGRIS